jgi:hypothetical protein
MSYADVIHAFLQDTIRASFAQAGAYATAREIFGSDAEQEAAAHMLRCVEHVVAEVTA